MSEGRVIELHIGAVIEGPMKSVREVHAIPGVGLEGDRKAQSGNEAGRQITLIEIEAIEALAASGVPFTVAESRRNVTTRGIGLNELVGREFTVGTVKLRGIKLCHPCYHLEGLTRAGVKQGLLNRGGLRAEILTDGVIRVGDAVKAGLIPPSA